LSQIVTAERLTPSDHHHDVALLVGIKVYKLYGRKTGTFSSESTRFGKYTDKVGIDYCQIPSS